ncbi:MAG TPA: lantibiotic dehydratase, partial [Candidatus Eisenbacteria bacterium]|nr:lantibiotic dehydratase [Candidatus Eisenbacteria bacterium]
GQDVGPFYAKLVERGVLIGEVEIPWSERRPLRALAARCPGASWAAGLETIEAEVDAMARLAPEAIPDRIDGLTRHLAALPRSRPLSEDDAIRCDAATALRVRLPRTLLRDLERLLPAYARFYGGIYPEALTRETYAARFLKRYPPDTPIPALDFYHGLFEPAPRKPLAAFTSAAAGSAPSPRRAEAGRAFERAKAFFTRRAREAANAGTEEVALCDEDWIEIAGDGAVPRFSCAALFQVEAASSDEVAASSARLCLNSIFPGAGLSVARLAHLHGGAAEANPIVGALREGWARRARPGAELAEITFMHGGRTANAGLRPPLFRLEIELPGDRATEGHEAVPLADLTAAWDSAAGRFALRSVSRGIDILPVISSGINPEGFVQFLTMVGEQDLQPLGLLPGFDDPEIRIWPRFRYGNVVLFRRRWVFAEEEMPSGATAEERFLAARRWVRAHGLPEHVFVHSDREPKPFYVNLGSPAFLDLLRRSVDGAGRMHVTEMRPGPDALWVRDGRGRYASEFLVHVDRLGEEGGA